MRRDLILLIMLISSQAILSGENLGAHVRLLSHQATLPYNSYEKETEPIKAYFKFALYNCTSDEATYVLAKESMYGGPTATLVEVCWKEFQENGKSRVVKKSGVSSLRNIDQSVIKEVLFDVWYGFKSKREACNAPESIDSLSSTKRARE